jgi:hypothetical protein
MNVKQVLLFLSVFLYMHGLRAQITDTVLPKDTINTPVAAANDSTSLRSSRATTYFVALQSLVSGNYYLNGTAKSESLAVREKKYRSHDLVFYAIAVILLLFGLLKMFYSRYLNNMIRVFFNTSLRQGQLTDQLLQAKLPSLLFNIFFVLIGGFYLYFLLAYLGHIDADNDYRVLLICIGSLAAVYLVKYCVLKFAGWVSGYAHEADTYIFIVFLINKIIAVGLIPIVMIMAFSDRYLVTAMVILSYVVIFMMLVLRFLRSWSILQNKVKVKRYHFFLYILGIEILPLLLIYKAAMDLLKNNL